MLAELRNTNKSRSSLRSRHLAQLEESKANLNEIKSLATQKLVSNAAVDQDLPAHEEGEPSGPSCSAPPVRTRI